MELLIWTIVWFGGMGFYYGIVKKKYGSYTQTPVIFCVWFVLMSYVCVRTFPESMRYVSSLLAYSRIVYSLVGVILMSIVTWFLYYTKIYSRLRMAHPKQTFAFACAKLFELIFQQICLVSLATLFFDKPYPITTATLFFGIVHIPLMIVLPTRIALFYVIASFAGSASFFWLVYNVPHGVIISLVVHMIFYITSSYAMATNVLPVQAVE